MKKLKNHTETEKLEIERRKNFSELDIMGPPKSLKRGKNFRTRNYFYRVFDNIASQLAVVNQGLKDSGPKRVWQLK